MIVKKTAWPMINLCVKKVLDFFKQTLHLSKKLFSNSKDGSRGVSLQLWLVFSFDPFIYQAMFVLSVCQGKFRVFTLGSSQVSMSSI